MTGLAYRAHDDTAELEFFTQLHTRKARDPGGTDSFVFGTTQP